MAGKELGGPFRHHVFIGFSPTNEKTVKMLRRCLETAGVICSLRGENESDTKRSIKRGVISSQKCMIFLTLDYIKDDWFTIETEEMINKAARFCRDILIILKADNAIETPERLKGYKELLFHPGMMDDELYIADLVNEVTKESNFQLSLLPKENIGYGAACGYFYGYLNLVLPDFKKRLVNEAFQYEAGELSKCVKKMLIIMPESCFCQTSLEMKDTNGEKLIEFTGKYVVRTANRAGNEKRDYKSSVFKLIDSQKQKEYYFVGELATPLLTMYEMYSGHLCGMTRDQLYLERDAFYFALKSILSHPDNSACNNQFKILYWSDPDPDTEKGDKLSLYHFLRPVLEEELELEREDERNAQKHPEPVSSPPLPLRRTFDPLEVHGPTPIRIYEPLSSYPMNSKARGKCIIFNIKKFDTGLQEREGAERDSEMLIELFKDLHFEAEVHIDVDRKGLETVLLTMSLCDHKKYDAFVCCILTHGSLGVIYTRDGKAVEILEIADFFTDKNCASLKGKPKLFFIQACQGGDEPENKGSQPAAIDQILQVQASPQTKSVNDLAADVESNLIITDGSGEAIDTDAIKLPTIGTLSDGNLKYKAVLVPGAPDFLMSYSTLPGSLSYRDTKTGSFYIQALNERLRQGQEIDRALKLVSGDVKEKLSKRDEQNRILNRFQLPFHLTSGMDRLIYL